MIAPDRGRPSDFTGVELLVFSDDWGRHPSSCQHLVMQLMARYPVVWCNTIGTRRPGLDLYTVRRGVEKLRSWIGPRPRSGGSSRPPGARPELIEPVMWPSFRSWPGRAFNRRQLRAAVRRLPSRGRRRIGVTTLPVVADLVGATPVDRWVYYCVDDLAAWPGLDRPSLERMERELVAEVDEIVAVSERLVERLASFGREAHLLTHGVDLSHWAAPRSTIGRRILRTLEPLERPLVVFWGVVDQRLDVSWIEELVRTLGRGTVVLVGPSNDPDPRLRGMPGLVFLGAVDYDELPEVAAASDVLIMPYRDLDATRAMQPLKLKEYLATGLPVVARALPALEAWRDACDVAVAAETFVGAVLERLRTGVPERQLAARRRLASEGWDRKAETFERILLGTSAISGGVPRSGRSVRACGMTAADQAAPVRR